MRYLLLFAVLCVPFAAAIGISPPAVQVEFQPGQLVTFGVSVFNYNAFPIDVEVTAEGELADSLRVHGPIRIEPQGGTPVQVSLQLPPLLDRPGKHVFYVYFTENFLDENSGFGARTSVALRVTVWQPYPGTYAEVVVAAEPVSQGNDSVVHLIVNNFGVEPLDAAKATVNVVSAQNVLKDVLTFTNISIPGNSNKDYYKPLVSRAYEPGRYTLATTLEYGENTSRMNGTFIVGTQDVDALSIDGPIYLDKPVNKLSLHVESLWNAPIENVHATILLGDRELQSPSVTLKPFATDVLSGYWETDTKLPPGQVLAKVTLFFDGKNKEVLLPITVYNETPRLPTVEEPGVVLSGADVLFILLALIIVICVVVYALQKHFHHGD